MLGKYKTINSLTNGEKIEFELMTIDEIFDKYHVDTADCPYIVTPTETLIRFDEDKWLVTECAIRPDELDSILVKVKANDIVSNMCYHSAVLVNYTNPSNVEYRTITMIDTSFSHDPDLFKNIQTVVSFDVGSIAVSKVYVSVHSYDIYKHGYLELVPVEV